MEVTYYLIAFVSFGKSTMKASVLVRKQMRRDAFIDDPSDSLF